MTRKHIAASGASAGQWVTCSAQKSCRNGGVHLDSTELKEISNKTYTPIKDLTEEDVNTYYAQTNPDPQQDTLLQRLMNLSANTPTPTPSTPMPTQEQIRDAVDRVSQENLVDRHLIHDDSLTIWEKRALFGKQRNQAQKILGSLVNYTTERIPETNELVFKTNSAQETSRLVFRPNPDDPKDYTAHHDHKYYHQGQEFRRIISNYNSAGELHGNGKPARIDESDEEETTEYMENGKLHRDPNQDGDQPAKISHHEDGTTTTWYKKEGKTHRDGGKPAIIAADSFTGRIKQSYYTDGELQNIEIRYPANSPHARRSTP